MSIKVINWFESQQISCVIDADWNTTSLKFNFTQHQTPPFSGRELLYYDYMMATRRMHAVTNLYHNPSCERIMGGPQFVPVLKALYDTTFKALERIEERLMKVDNVLSTVKAAATVFEVQVDGDDVFFTTTSELVKWSTNDEREYYENLLNGLMCKAVLKYWTTEKRTNALMGIGDRSYTTAAISKLTKAFQNARKGIALGLPYYTAKSGTSIKVTHIPPAPVKETAPAPAPLPKITKQEIMAIKKASETEFKPVKAAKAPKTSKTVKATKTVTMKSLVVETLTWDNLAIAKYGTAEGLKSGQKAAITRELHRRQELANPLTTEEVPAPKAPTPAAKAPKAAKKSLKTIVINEPITFSNLAIAMYGTDKGLSRGKVGAVNREINRRKSNPAPQSPPPAVTPAPVTADNDDKTKFPSKYIKTLLPNTPVTFNTLAEAMYGTASNLSRAQNLIVQQEITRRRFVPIV